MFSVLFFSVNTQLGHYFIVEQIKYKNTSKWCFVVTLDCVL